MLTRLCFILLRIQKPAAVSDAQLPVWILFSAPQKMIRDFA
jgi:hypothetical protein